VIFQKIHYTAVVS